MTSKHQLSEKDAKALLEVLKERFEKNRHRHEGVAWSQVVEALSNQPDKLWSVNEMERTGGEPDVVVFPGEKGITFVDCSAESPALRRSLCYDAKALEERKENKPEHSALGQAQDMGIDVLDEAQYAALQQFGPFDQKTSSWVKTPGDIRKLGGGLFMNYHYGRVFTYYNGVQSYYAARGYRGMVTL